MSPVAHRVLTIRRSIPSSFTAGTVLDCTPCRTLAQFCPWPFVPGGHRLASESVDGSIKLWDADTGQLLSTDETRTIQVYSFFVIEQVLTCSTLVLIFSHRASSRTKPNLFNRDLSISSTGYSVRLLIGPVCWEINLIASWPRRVLGCKGMLPLIRITRSESGRKGTIYPSGPCCRMTKSVLGAAAAGDSCTPNQSFLR
jgi:WD40 repeat protein